MGFWLQMGVAGFRVDAVPFLIELKGAEQTEAAKEYAYLEEFRQFLSWRSRDAIVMGEANVTIDELPEYFGDGDRMQMLLNFMANQHLFNALAQEDATPLMRAMETLPKLPAMTPHTAAKHKILRQYLDRWFPILGRTERSINYIDGFAGPGEYQGGEVGSPQIAIEAARVHVERGTLAPDVRIDFTFVEADPDSAQNLRAKLSALSLPPSFEWEVVPGEFAEVGIWDLGGDEKDEQRIKARLTLPDGTEAEIEPSRDSGQRFGAKVMLSEPGVYKITARPGDADSGGGAAGAAHPERPCREARAGAPLPRLERDLGGHLGGAAAPDDLHDVAAARSAIRAACKRTSRQTR